MSGTRAAIFHGPGVVRVESVPTPTVTRGEVLVRVLGCTLCGSDLHTFAGRREVETPTILGHEIVGRIEAFGDDVEPIAHDGAPLAVGDRVVWAIVASCDQCFPCANGLPQKCEAAVKYGHEPYRGNAMHGGLAERCVLAPGTAILKVPDTMPLETACPIGCATATVAAAVDALERAIDLNGRVACVFGLGLLGLTATAMLSEVGARVIATDPNPERRRLARAFGAATCVDACTLEGTTLEATDGRGADAIVELSGAAEAIEAARDVARIGSVWALAGTVFPSDHFAVPTEQIVRRNLTILGIHNYTPDDLRRALAFVTTHSSSYPFAELVSGWHPLDDIDDAFADAARGESIRVGVRMA